MKSARPAQIHAGCDFPTSASVTNRFKSEAMGVVTNATGLTQLRFSNEKYSGDGSFNQWRGDVILEHQSAHTTKVQWSTSHYAAGTSTCYDHRMSSAYQKMRAQCSMTVSPYVRTVRSMFVRCSCSCRCSKRRVWTTST